VRPVVTDRRVLLFFIDGIGVGSDDPDRNPLASDDFAPLRLTESRTPMARQAWANSSTDWFAGT